jgi:hypothetical protein
VLLGDLTGRHFAGRVGIERSFSKIRETLASDVSSRSHTEKLIFDCAVYIECCWTCFTGFSLAVIFRKDVAHQ